MKYSSLRAANKTRQAEWPGSGKADLCFRALELAGEAGEAVNKAKALIRLSRGIAGTTHGRRDVAVAELADELADVAITADLVAMEVGVDLGDAVVRKFNADSAKHALKTTLAQSSITSMMMSLSTGHITEATSQMLNDTPDTSWPVTGGTYGGYGYFFSTYQARERPRDLDIPDDLWALLCYALENQCSYLMLDQDADLIDGLPQYDW